MSNTLSTDIRLRPATRGDIDGMRRLIQVLDLFPTEALAPMIAPYLAGDDAVWLLAEDAAGALAGLAYADEEEMTDRTWNLLALGVSPNHRRRGVARALIDAVETAARDRGARLLLVETASGDAFDDARRLYRAVGFQGEARIPGFWAQDVDKISFWKPLDTL